MALLKLVFLKGQRQIPFFKVLHPSTEEPKALMKFKLRTEPELSTRNSHSTSAPLPPWSHYGVPLELAWYGRVFFTCTMDNILYYE